MALGPLEHYVLADTRESADKAATSWGWTRAQSTLTFAWRNHSGAQVKYAPDAISLRALPRGTIIYLGPGWSELKGAGGLSDLAKKSGYVIMFTGKKSA